MAVDATPNCIFLSTLPARGATRSATTSMAASSLFLSTLPARGATGGDAEGVVGKVISIHAPREGSDHLLAVLRFALYHFYPRSPRGERRPGCCAEPPSCRYFYPRSPRGERQICRTLPRSRSSFLSTLPARGATGACGGAGRCGTDFYPRSPRGERPSTADATSP